MISEAQHKAIRTFIIGLKNSTTRNILYGQKPQTLAEAFTVAQTVFYDSQYLQFNETCESQKNERRNPPRTPQHQYAPKKFYPGTGFNVNMNCNPPQQNQLKNAAEPMEMDSPNRFKNPVNWRERNQQTNETQRREYDFPRQQLQQQNKFQRINQIQTIESNKNEGYEEDICDDIPDDLISNSSHTSNKTTTSSAFLGV